MIQLLSRALCTASLTVLAAQASAQVTVTEFPIPTANSRPYTIVAGADGNLWFTESVGNKLGRITTAGVITEFAVPSPQSGPYGIAVGADGKIWFTERFADRIGRFSPATGQFTEFPIPTPFAQPWDIALGPDGNLWFTEEDVNQIGRITPLGTVNEFVPPSCCFPTGICAGRDGRMWFTLEIGDQIGRVELSGAITMFQIASTQVLPWDIAPGPDGGVWFTELAGRAIGRISTGGQIVEHPIPGPFSGIAGVTTGPDGNLWFTENDSHHVGSMDIAGTVVELLEVGERPLSIALGPDGNLWFTEADENAIGRVNLAQLGSEHVLSIDAGFAPKLRTAALGSNIQWTFLGPKVHAVTDASGLGLFDSGPQRIVSTFSVSFDYASTFAYSDGPTSPPTAGIAVPVDLPSSAQVGIPFPMTWALVPAPPGIAFDVQVRVPGASGFVDWMVGTQNQGSDYTPTAPGNHRFRARLRDPSSGASTRYSRPASVVVQ